MSVKTFIQILIIILIFSILGSVYFKYFNINQSVIQETEDLENNNEKRIKDLEKKISDLEIKNLELNKEIKKEKESFDSSSLTSKKEVNQKEKSISKKENIKETQHEILEKKEEREIEKAKTKNLVKDVEYTSLDQKGNRFILLASSGKSNVNNSDILDLINVRGKITSDTRDTIYIVSDFAQYNSINLNSKFYENVIINYQDKEITCKNFDINMNTNKAIAYNDVLIVDPKSEMKAGIVEFDLKTKNIEIKPESALEEIEIISD